MNKPFSKLKNLKKAIEGALLTGAAAGGVIEAVKAGGDVDITTIEQAITILIAAGVGAAYKALINYLKNR
jgi:hypothetical protein